MNRSPVHQVLKRLKRYRIGVILGGSSREREISLQTGAAVKKALSSWGLKPLPIEARGDLVGRLRRNKISFAYLALHGKPGEDGTFQGLLEAMGIPYTGSGVLASALALNKPCAKMVFQRAGVPTPPWRELSRARIQESAAAVKALGLPVVVKPAEQGSALGVTVVKKKNQLKRALANAFAFGQDVLVEEYISGTEVTVGILGSQALPVVEIVPAHGFYDFYSKYSPGGSRHLFPARLPDPILKRAQSVALRAFSALGCRAYGRVDLIIRADGTPFVLEVNTIPGMTSVSLLPDAARAAGIPFEELVLRIIEYSLRN